MQRLQITRQNNATVGRAHATRSAVVPRPFSVPRSPAAGPPQLETIDAPAMLMSYEMLCYVTYSDDDMLSGDDARVAALHPDIFDCRDVPCHLTYSEDETD